MIQLYLFKALKFLFLKFFYSLNVRFVRIHGLTVGGSVAVTYLIFMEEAITNPLLTHIRLETGLSASA